MSSTSNRNNQTTVEHMEEVSQEHMVLPEDNTVNTKYDPSLCLPDSNLNTSRLHPDTLTNVAAILIEWLKNNIDSKTKSIIVTPTSQGILLEETTNNRASQSQSPNTRTRRDGYVQDLSYMKSQLQDEAYIEGYSNALDDVENKFFMENFENDFNSEFDADSENESQSGYDSEYDSEHDFEDDSEHEGSVLSDTHSDACSICMPFSKIEQELDKVCDPTEVDKIRLFKMIEATYGKLITETTFKTNSIRQAMITGEVSSMITRLSPSDMENVGGINMLYAKIAAYVLEHESFCDSLETSLLSMRGSFTSTQCEAENPTECECNDIRIKGFGRDSGLASSRKQYSQAAGKSLAAATCEDCVAALEGGDATPDFGIFEEDQMLGRQL